MLKSAVTLFMGTEPAQRLRMQRYLYALTVYLFCGFLQFGGAAVGLADYSKAGLLFIFIGAGQLFIYIALRGGWNLQFPDPSLTMLQMIFANIAIGLAYVVNEHAHSMMTMLMALVLSFSAFVLSPAECRRLGWWCVATLAVALVVAAGSLSAALVPNVDAFHFAMSAVVLPVMGHLMGQLSGLRLRQQRQKQDLREALEKVRRLATHDELTGLPNRRHALDLLALEERKNTRGTGLSCLSLIDIDHFKRINDTLGHPAGDETLRLFAALLGGGLRPGDVVARWGGEEFLVLLPSTSIEEATLVMERLRERCADPAQWSDRPHLQVTLSGGLTSHKPGEPTQVAVARADAALYQAKAAGRNRVTLA
jgi:diguanylate cyclase (GGDEF)-like protein